MLASSLLTLGLASFTSSHSANYKPHAAVHRRPAFMLDGVVAPPEAAGVLAASPTELAAKAREWVLNDGFHQPAAKPELMADDFV